MIDEKKLIMHLANWQLTTELNSVEYKTIEECIKAIEEQPQADKWISVEEGLPEKYGDYLVTIIPKAGVLWKRIIVARYSDLMGICVQPSFHIGEVGKDSFEKLEGVVAWQPLPQPYKKEGAENEK